MQFDCWEARSILLRQDAEVEIRDSRGRVLVRMPAKAAAEKCKHGGVCGIGNNRRIRFLRVEGSGFMAEDSRTTSGHRSELQTHNRKRCEAYDRNT